MEDLKNYINSGRYPVTMAAIIFFAVWVTLLLLWDGKNEIPDTQNWTRDQALERPVEPTCVPGVPFWDGC